MDTHGRIVRLLKDAFLPSRVRNIHLTLISIYKSTLKSLLAGRVLPYAEDPHDGSVLAMVSMPSYDPNPFGKRH
ncbi:hypothetical protein KCP69_17805 [Salmonella enterica subsp. enterica]|nr:hypothetical protein KCP69_17805 [Salmonella enterica subsp. enterica]